MSGYDGWCSECKIWITNPQNERETIGEYDRAIQIQTLEREYNANS
jgi:hypothetical protein